MARPVCGYSVQIRVHLQYQNLLTGYTEKVHGRRLKLFQNSDYEVMEELRNHLSYQEGEYQCVQEFVGIRHVKEEIEFQVKWRCFTLAENDWVSATSLREDFLVMFEQYVDDLLANGSPHERKLAESL